MTDGRRITDPKSFLENFAMCLIEAGVDVSRITTGVTVLHPQLYSYSGLWERGKGVTERLYRLGREPGRHSGEQPDQERLRGQPLRDRLTVPAAEREFPILTELRRTLQRRDPKAPNGAPNNTPTSEPSSKPAAGSRSAPSKPSKRARRPHRRHPRRHGVSNDNHLGLPGPHGGARWIRTRDTVCRTA